MNLQCILHREIVTFLFHTYPEDSGLGKSTCEFTLAEVYLKMNGTRNENITYEPLLEDRLNRSQIEQVLKGVQSRARGKKIAKMQYLVLCHGYLSDSQKILNNTSSTMIAHPEKHRIYNKKAKILAKVVSKRFCPALLFVCCFVLSQNKF